MKPTLTASSIQNILITGISGYLGSHLAKALAKQGYNITGLIRKSTDTSGIQDLLKFTTLYMIEDQGIEKAFAEQGITAVIHCATNYGRQNETHEDIFKANVDFPAQVLKIGKQYGLKYFLNTHTLLDRNTNSYSECKYHFLDLLKNESTDIFSINLSLEHFYGPKDNSTKFISWIIKNCLDEAPSIPLTLGEQKRDFIHIDDVVTAYMQVLKWSESLKTHGIYFFEVGTGNMTTIKEVVELIYKICKTKTTKLEFGKIPYRKNEKMIFKVNLTSIKSIGWEPKINLLEGLTSTIEIENSFRKGIL